MRGFVQAAPTCRPSPIHCLSDTPAVAVAVSYSLGIALSLPCRDYSFAGLAASAFFLVAASFLAFRRNRLILSLALGLAAIAIGGLLMALAQRDGIHASDVRSHISRCDFPLRTPVAFDGCVVKESDTRGGQISTTVELQAFRRKDERLLCKGKAILRIAEPDRESSPGPGFRLMRGDAVRGWANWSIPRNYENPGSADNAGMLARRGVFVIGRVKSLRLLEVVREGCSDPWTRVANAVGTRVRKSLEPVRKTHGRQPEAILASLVIGDYSGLDNGTRETFQNAGTFHVLVVSGLHVAWIAAVFLQFFKLVQLPEPARYILATLLILLYTCVVGFQASITRCLWMFLLYLAGRAIFRRADPVNILLGSAFILLLAQPGWLFDTGFQLSFLSVLSIALTAGPAINAFLKPLLEPSRHCGKADRLFLRPGRWERRGRELRTRGELLIEDAADRCAPGISQPLLAAYRGIASGSMALGSLLMTTIAVQLWLEPLLARDFNRLSWIAPVANLVIVPFSSIVLSTGMACALTADVPFLGSMLTGLAGLLASRLLSCAVRMTAVPGTWQRCPTPATAWVLAGILSLFAWGYFRWRRPWIPCAGIAAMLACVSQGSVPLFGSLLSGIGHAIPHRDQAIWEKDTPVLSFTFLDVGEGDSTVIRFPDMRVWVLDAGGARQPASQEEGDYGFNAGDAVVSRFLWHEWIGRIERLMMSHPDIDHAGGIPALMNNFSIGRFEYPRAGSGAIVTGIVDAACERRIEIRQIHADMREKVGPVGVRVRNPPARMLFSTTNENSAVLEFTFHRFTALLTGDLEKSGEAAVLSQRDGVKADLLKVAHHGSRSGTSNRFLDQAQPRWAVISVGRNNPFGHPSHETLSRLWTHGLRPFLTVNEGAITFETDGRRYLLRSHVNGLLEHGDL